MQIDSLLVTNLSLIFAFSVEFFIAFIVLRKDTSYRANQLLSIAYVCLGLTILVNFIYLAFSFSDQEIVLFHKMTNVFAILFGIFLFATVSFIRFGSNGFKKEYFLIINVICIISVIAGLLYDGVVVIFYNNSPQTLWDLNYLLLASVPIFLLGSSSVYYFIKLYYDLKDDETIKRQLQLSIIAYSVITIAYFLSRVPFYVIELYPEYRNTGQVIGLTASTFVVVFSILIARIFLQRKVTT